jgi:hypothetical protein
MLPKDLTPAVIEKLKKTAETYPVGSVPENFDPLKFSFRSNTNFIVNITLDKRSKSPYWLLSMSFPTRPPTEQEAKDVVAAFFGADGLEKAGRILMPEGSNPNIVYYRLSA